MVLFINQKGLFFFWNFFVFTTSYFVFIFFRVCVTDNERYYLSKTIYFFFISFFAFMFYTLTLLDINPVDFESIMENQTVFALMKYRNTVYYQAMEWKRKRKERKSIKKSKRLFHSWFSRHKYVFFTKLYFT